MILQLMKKVFRNLKKFLEKYKIAIEYQGQQHYEAVSLFGGDEGLKYNQERDRRKKKGKQRILYKR